jgi:hypothetical protein
VIYTEQAIEISSAWFGHPGRQLSPNTSTAIPSSARYSTWAKPLSALKVAVLVVSMEQGVTTIDVALDMKAIAPQLSCGTGGAKLCKVGDVWASASAGTTTASGALEVKALAGHDSRFFVVSSA